MGRPAFVDIPDTDIDADSPLLSTLFESMRDNTEAVRVQAFTWAFAEQTTASTSFVAKDLGIGAPYVRISNIEDYTGIARVVRFRFYGKTTAGTASFKLTDSDSAVTATITTTSTSYVVLEIAITMASGTKGTNRVLVFEMKTTAGTASAIGKGCICDMDY